MKNPDEDAFTRTETESEQMGGPVNSRWATGPLSPCRMELNVAGAPNKVKKMTAPWKDRAKKLKNKKKIRTAQE